MSLHHRIGKNIPPGGRGILPTQPGGVCRDEGGIYPLGGLDKTLLTEAPLLFDFFLFKLFRRIKM